MNRFLRIIRNVFVVLCLVVMVFGSYKTYTYIEDVEGELNNVRKYTMDVSEQNSTLFAEQIEVNTMILDLLLTQGEINKVLEDKVVELIDKITEPDYNYVKQTTAEIKVGRAGGTGNIIFQDDKYLYVLTAKHVLDGTGSVAVKIKNKEGKSFIVEKISRDLVYEDTEVDVGLIKVEKPEGEYAVMGIAKTRFPIGSKVYTVGHPYNLHYTLNRGIISNYIKRMFDNESKDCILVSINTYPGNSGGAVINKYSQLVGVMVGVIYTYEGRKTRVNHSQLAIVVTLEDVYRFLKVVSDGDTKEEVEEEAPKENNNFARNRG